ncbi:MAG: flagellar basal body rod protein FlgC [Planctomycetes bacterium]|nr:flagellar basal body rod protein FlgC [Planctomycetota bacterium]
MKIDSIPNVVDIAVSGLRAQSLRMNVTAGNIANINTTRTDSGEPYRKRHVVLSAASDGLGGVEIGGVQTDQITKFKRLYQPGHPDADESGYVNMPNLQLPSEMMEMMSASRAYQANAATLKRYQDSIDVTLELLR